MGANDLLKPTGRPAVISVGDSQLRPPPNLKGKVALMSNNELLVGDAYANDPAVHSYLSLVRRARKVHVGIKSIGLDELGEILSSADKISHTGKRSATQSEVLARIRDGYQRRSSDIHFVNGETTTKIKYRIDGVLRTVDEITVADGMALCRSMYESMTDVSQGTYNEHVSQDARIERAWLKEIGLTGSRIATRPLEVNNLFVLRLLYPGSLGNKTLPGLGYSPEQIAEINRMIRRDGVNLFSGSTGSGKSTSLMVICKMILELFSYNIHLLTIEDPPEYDIPGANQTPLKYDATKPDEVGRAWALAISNAMRLDPDFLMVGELRDFSSTMAAIQAAMTGHGLWTTTHAKHIFASLDRLADLNVPIGRLTDASLITGLINQSLVPRLCPHPGCARPFSKFKDEVAEDVRERIIKYCDADRVMIRCRADNTDCPVCGGLGYYERTVAAEVATPTQKLMDVYRTHGSHEARRYWVKEMGGMTSMQHMIRKINEGIVDPVAGEEAMRRGLDEDELTLA
ncbi:Flp pilus assembly complex ATPase component TadA (plasmid) [Burkholderia vietnamiensis]|uniref:Type II secretion system protein E n=1 Tax=Burkholderia vietnamiensis (strain G4 / LMG 22486) TaxID=269482 RepID=A4JVG7_BURVG|nr:type II secretion system protein E [Burkholderia vietnamiensis G4]MCB4349458.1 Flp pilus assembly complex ATPase component TadA [Burkholderia vietnamiensis]